MLFVEQKHKVKKNKTEWEMENSTYTFKRDEPCVSDPLTRIAN